MEKNNIQSNSHRSTNIPDLTVEMCPFSCGEGCERIWTNSVIPHKIICDCYCHKIKNNAADGFGSLDSAASSQCTSEVTKVDDQ